MKVSLFVTCFVDQVRPSVGVASVRLLRRLGCQVEFEPAQACCGQPAYNAGFTGEARTIARSFVETFEPAEAIVVPSGSCAAFVRAHLAQLFDDEHLGARARRVAARTYELTQFVVGVLGRTDVGARFAHKVAFHPSCHALRTLGLRDEPLALLRAVAGLELVPLVRAEDCCGFGGAFCVKLPEISTAIADEKLDHLVESGATHFVSTDAACLESLASRARRRGLALEAVHVAEVLGSAA